MSSLYPQRLDRFRPWLEGADQFIALDLNDLFDALIGIENELGIDPSGGFGTIFGRLFGRGYVSRTDGRWVPVITKNEGFNKGSDFREKVDPGQSSGPYAIGVGKNYDEQRWRTIETEWGTSTPAVFPTLMADPQYYDGMPWAMVIFDAGKSGFRVFGRDAHARELNSGNSRDGVKWGWVAWGMSETARRDDVQESALDSGGGEAAAPAPPSVKTITAHYTARNGDRTILVDCATGGGLPITVTLPDAASAYHDFDVKKIDAGSGAVTIATTGTDTIDGATSVVINVPHDDYTVRSDGANWRIV